MTFRTKLFVTLLSALFSSSLLAQNQQGNGQSTPNAQPNQLKLQVVPPSPWNSPPPAQVNRFYFGMNVQLVSTYYGKVLRVVNVTPNSPAARAGLEYGDEILSMNGGRFDNLYDSFAAVRRMNQLVRTEAIWSAPAAAGSAPAATAYVIPQQPTRNIAHMQVRNVRNGQMVNVTVEPTQRNFSQPYPMPAPAAASTAFR